MKTIILIADHRGYPSRLIAPATAAETLCICPHDKPQAHASSVRMPDEWLPASTGSATDMGYGKKCWWRCEMLFVAAVQQLGLDADFYWCVESDVAALPVTWQRLMLASEKRFLDGVYVNLGPREGDKAWAGWWLDPGTPQWASHRHLGAMFRLSRRAMGWLADAGEECREAFCEISNASVVHRAGGSTGDLRQLGWFYSTACLRPAPHRPFIHPDLFCHPMKFDSVGPEVVD